MLFDGPCRELECAKLSVLRVAKSDLRSSGSRILPSACEIPKEYQKRGWFAAVMFRCSRHHANVMRVFQLSIEELIDSAAEPFGTGHAEMTVTSWPMMCENITNNGCDDEVPDGAV
jgi:hypothetical protein